MKFLITGLGNPGPEYHATRHNIGFDCLDALAEKHGATFKDARYGFVAEFSHKGRQFHLLKPTTFMNLSGKAVRYWLNKHKLEPASLLVIVDDLNLPLGTLRLRASGSHGGHNGLRDIDERIGHQRYARLRFGIGSNFGRGRQVDFVLSTWDDEEIPIVNELVPKCGEAVVSFGTAGIERTMNQFNTRNA